MAALNYDKMSLKELRDIEGRVAAALVKAHEREKADLKHRIEEMTGKAGMSVQDLYGMTKGRGAGKGGKVAIKYMNPDNKGETWTGRGRQPRWLAAKLSKGGKINDFLL
jgi:DNA-binding protein H-NS